MIERAARKAGQPHWTPLQLRHTALTLIRERHGLEAAQAVGGHSRLTTTQIYAERIRVLALKAAEDVG